MHLLILHLCERVEKIIHADEVSRPCCVVVFVSVLHQCGRGVPSHMSEINEQYAHLTAFSPGSVKGFKVRCQYNCG